MSLSVTISPDALGLLKAILDDPADDLPRLAYADWLEENGQEERAEFIRYDIRYPHAGFAELTGKPDALAMLGVEPIASVHVGNPASFAAGLDRDDWRTWMWGESDELGCVISDMGRGLDYKVRRGFVEAVRCTLDAWLAHGPAVVRAHPVTSLTLTDRRPWPDLTSDRRQWLRRPKRKFGILTPAREPSALPRRLHDAVYEGHDSPWFPDEAAATLALSEGGIRWAKLPPEERQG